MKKKYQKARAKLGACLWTLLPGSASLCNQTLQKEKLFNQELFRSVVPFYFIFFSLLPNTVLKFRVLDETNPEKLVHSEATVAGGARVYFPRYTCPCQPFKLSGGHSWMLLVSVLGVGLLGIVGVCT